MESQDIEEPDLLAGIKGAVDADPELGKKIKNILDKEPGEESPNVVTKPKLKAQDVEENVPMTTGRIATLCLIAYSPVVILALMFGMEYGLMAIWGGFVLIIILTINVIPSHEDAMAIYRELKGIRKKLPAKPKDKKVKEEKPKHKVHRMIYKSGGGDDAK